MPQPLMGLTKNRTCVPMSTSSDTPAVGPLTIQFSVGVGGKNLPADVLNIQQALNRVPTNQGGPTPSLVPDSWIGPNTCGAIRNFQTFHFGKAKADGRVDPNQYTIAKLREFQDTAVPGCGCGPKPSSLVPTSTPPATDSRSIMDKVYDSLPTCMLWNIQARRCLNKAISLQSGEVSFEEVDDAAASRDLVDRCFKIKELTTADGLREMLAIRMVFNKINRVITSSVRNVQFFHLAPPGSETQGGKVIQAFTYPGGFTRRDASGNPPMSNVEFVGPNLSQNGIYICEPNVKDSTAIHLVDILNHEMAHFAGPEAMADRIQDPAGNLAALELSHHLSMRCASNYAWLAWLARLPQSQWLTDMG